MLLSELVTGEAPFAELENERAISKALDRGERPRLPAPDPDDAAATAVVDLIVEMWVEEPAERPNAEAVSDRIALAHGMAIARASTAGRAGQGQGICVRKVSVVRVVCGVVGMYVFVCVCLYACPYLVVKRGTSGV